MRTEWNLTLLYKSPKDPAIEQDLLDIEKKGKAFAKKHKSGAFLRSEAALKRALDEYQALFAELSPAKPLAYFHNRCDLDAADTGANARLMQISARMSKVGALLLFFELSIGKLPKAAQKKYLTSKPLASYKLYLERVFKQASHTLSEAEERVLLLTGQPRVELWIAGVDRAVSSLTVPFEGKELPMGGVFPKITDLPTKKRRALHASAMRQLAGKAEFAESELNALATAHKIDDELRNFSNPWSATAEGYEISEATVKAIRDGVAATISTAHRFYKLKAKLLKEKRLTYADRGAKIGEIGKKFTFEDSARIYQETIGAMDPEYAAIFESYLQNGQIDVYPKKGKTGGAYCFSSIGMPTWLLLNHTDSFRSLSTLAHEMGHATHYELSKKHQPFYQGLSTAVTETASTLFEGLLADAMLPTLSPKDRIVALHDLLNDAIATVYRQVACFEFEAAFHQEVRERGFVTQDRIRELMNEKMGWYLGPAVKLTPEDGNFFVTWGHLRRHFYVISYVYGILLSFAMREKLAKDPGYAKEIKKFLSLGSSMTPENIFKSIGIDTADPNTFKNGLKVIERNLIELEKLTK